MKNCLLCGVGGQGTVLASRVIASAAIKKGKFARTAETIGMAQRGGCVVSHVRIGDDCISPLIPLSQADIILGFEPGEVVRNIDYLKKDGCIIVCDKSVNPVIRTKGCNEYDGTAAIEYLKNNVKRCFVIDVNEAAKICGSEKAINIVLVGALIRTGKLEIDKESVEEVLKERVKPQFFQINKTALQLGSDMIERNL